MSLDLPTYLNSSQNNIRARPIPWDGAVRAGTITDNDLKKIKAVDKVRKEQRKQTVEADLEAYRSLILGGKDGKSILESAAKRTDVIQYMLVLTGDLLNGKFSSTSVRCIRNRNFKKMVIDVPSLPSALLEHSDPYKPFLPLLSHSTNLEDPIPLFASSVLTNIVSNAQPLFPKGNSKLDEALRKLYTYLSKLTKSDDSVLQDIAVQEYSSLLRTKNSREIFWALREETVTPLVGILQAAAGVDKDADTVFSGGASTRSVTEAGLSGGVGLQMLYHVLLAVWQLSFEGALIGEGLEKYVAFFKTPFGADC